MEKGKFITKHEAGMLQGIAVMLMVCHHLFGFPERIAVPYNIVFDFSFFHFETMLSYFGKICISMFAFISGYGMCKMAYQKLSNKNALLGGYKMSFKHLTKFYPRFWAVCLVFLPIGLFLKKYSFDIKTLILSVLGFSSVYNGEWWYTVNYLVFLCVFPILFLVLSKLPSKRIISSVLFVVIIILYIFIPKMHALLFYLCFLSGMLVVNIDLFEIAYDILCKLGKFKYLIVLVIAGMAVGIRIFCNLNCDYDFIITPILIFCINVFLKSKPFKKTFNYLFSFVGKYSTYIWLTHTFFAYYLFQKITYAPRYSLLIFIWCMILTIATGFILETIVSSIEKTIRKSKQK